MALYHCASHKRTKNILHNSTHVPNPWSGAQAGVYNWPRLKWCTNRHANASSCGHGQTTRAKNEMSTLAAL